VPIPKHSPGVVDHAPDQLLCWPNFYIYLFISK